MLFSYETKFLLLFFRSGINSAKKSLKQSVSNLRLPDLQDLQDLKLSIALPLSKSERQCEAQGRRSRPSIEHPNRELNLLADELYQSRECRDSKLHTSKTAENWQRDFKFPPPSVCRPIRPVGPRRKAPGAVHLNDTHPVRPSRNRRCETPSSSSEGSTCATETTQDCDWRSNAQSEDIVDLLKHLPFHLTGDLKVYHIDEGTQDSEQSEGKCCLCIYISISVRAAHILYRNIC